MAMLASTKRLPSTALRVRVERRVGGVRGLGGGTGRAFGRLTRSPVKCSPFDRAKGVPVVGSPITCSPF